MLQPKVNPEAFFLLSKADFKQYSSDVVLLFHKVRVLTRDRFKKE